VEGEAQHTIGTRTVRGMVWAYGSYVGGRFLVLLSTAVLARLLVPEEFGVVALALTFMALLEVIADLGLSQALVIQPDEVTEERSETVFVSSVVLGFGLSAVIAALSPFAAAFFDEPALVGITAALGANVFLRSLGVTHYALAQKRLDFRARTAAELTGVVVRGLVGIALALAGLGAWSLVIGYLAGTLALDAAIWKLVPWRPSLRPSREHLPHLLRFGGTLSAVDVIAAIISNLDYIFIGRVLGATALGLYTLGFRLPELIVINLSVVAGRVLFPAFSAVDPYTLGRAYLVALRYTLVIALPMAVALAILAEPLIRVAFGDQWLGSVTAMQVLTIYALAVAIGIPAGTVYKSTGRAGVLLKLAVLRLALLLTGLFLFVDLGINAVAACMAAAAGTTALIGIALASRLLRVGLGGIWSEVWPSLLAAAAMALPTLAIERVVDAPVVVLVLAGIAGGGVYLAAIRLVAPDWVRYLRSKMRPAPSPAPAALPETRETDVIA
jgi:O-antigen/teichoic acid export membrane protein